MQAGLNRSYGVCMTMGTASTMTGLADVLGMCLPGSSSIPAPDSNHVGHVFGGRLVPSLKRS